MQAIVQAANILEISEYEVFCRAYQDWHGQAGDDALIQASYNRYFRGDHPPPWAAHYARRVIASFEAESRACCAWLKLCLQLLGLGLKPAYNGNDASKRH